MMPVYRMLGRLHAAPPPQDWREQLAQRLGVRPRRIGLWAELALYGALACLDAAGEIVLPSDARIVVASRRGPVAATGTVLEQGRDDLPMPLTFLQTQPSQMLALLGAHLHWTGDACFVSACDPLAVLRLAAARSGSAGMLLGWVDEADGGSTSWLRLQADPGWPGDFRRAEFADLLTAQVTHLRVAQGGLERSAA